MMTDKIKIRTIIVEDEEKILNNICSRIESLDDTFEIVAKARNGKEALEKIDLFRPQVVFTDISMPVMGGMELIRRIRQIHPSTVIVIISGYSDFSYAQEAIRYSVFNYLLKPVEDEVLADTLLDIRQSVSYLGVTRKRHIEYSENYQLISEREELFFVCNICIGNIIYDTQAEAVNQFYADRIKDINLQDIMDAMCRDGEEWLVIDEHAINQKMVEIKNSENSGRNPLEMAEKLMQVITERTGLPVNLCVSKEFIAKNELQDYGKRLRNTLRQKLVIGENHIFTLEEEEQSKNDVIEIVKMKLNQYIKKYFISTDLDHFMNEIETIFKYMKSNHAPQSAVEKICFYVLRLLEFSDQGYEKVLLDDLAEQMMNKISISISEDELFESLFREFRSLSQYQKTKNEEDDENKLLDYVNERFLTIESMEEVADHFGYNYAYLSRIFKKKAGESMSRYITKKKISLAKELIETKPDMKLVEISELCGYEDSRYFSRVFKAETGTSPSEYKEKIIKGENAK